MGLSPTVCWQKLFHLRCSFPSLNWKVAISCLSSPVALRARPGRFCLRHESLEEEEAKVQKQRLKTQMT